MTHPDFQQVLKVHSTSSQPSDAKHCPFTTALRIDPPYFAIMKFSAIIAAAACLSGAALVSATPKLSLMHIATALGKGLTHAAEFANAAQHGDHLKRQKVNVKSLTTLLRKIGHKLGEAGKIGVTAAGEGSAAAESTGTLVNIYQNYKAAKQSQAPAGYSGYMYRRGLDEEGDLGLVLRDLEQYLYVRGWDEELEILRRDFEDLLVERDFEELNARDSGEYDSRGFVEVFDARDFEEELYVRDPDEYEFDARDFAEELDDRDFEIDELD
ncbi:hypothetical protein C0995_005284 [Termitomyces sp. Mi166|nr:hypothetical protein C0995_005284 [Termitomyces sp. Mi166\